MNKWTRWEVKTYCDECGLACHPLNKCCPHCGAMDETTLGALARITKKAVRFRNTNPWWNPFGSSFEKQVKDAP